MSDSTSATTIASYTMAIHMALEANGHDAAAVFKAAGLSDAPSQDPLDRYTTVQMATLFREAVKSTGNPAFGLVAARFLHPSNVHALGYALLASATLRDACERLVYYFRIASNQGSYRIEESEGRFCLVLEVVADGVAFETIDAWNAFIIRVFRMIYRPDFKPLSRIGRINALFTQVQQLWTAVDSFDTPAMQPNPADGEPATLKIYPPLSH